METGISNPGYLHSNSNNQDKLHPTFGESSTSSDQPRLTKTEPKAPGSGEEIRSVDTASLRKISSESSQPSSDLIQLTENQTLDTFVKAGISAEANNSSETSQKNNCESSSSVTNTSEPVNLSLPSVPLADFLDPVQAILPPPSTEAFATTSQEPVDLSLPSVPLVDLFDRVEAILPPSSAEAFATNSQESIKDSLLPPLKLGETIASSANNSLEKAREEISSAPAKDKPLEKSTTTQAVDATSLSSSLSSDDDKSLEVVPTFVEPADKALESLALRNSKPAESSSLSPSDDKSLEVVPTFVEPDEKALESIPSTNSKPSESSSVSASSDKSLEVVPVFVKPDNKAFESIPLTSEDKPLGLSPTHSSNETTQAHANGVELILAKDCLSSFQRDNCETKMWNNQFSFANSSHEFFDSFGVTDSSMPPPQSHGDFATPTTAQAFNSTGQLFQPHQNRDVNPTPFQASAEEEFGNVLFQSTASKLFQTPPPTVAGSFEMSGTSAVQHRSNDDFSTSTQAPSVASNTTAQLFKLQHGKSLLTSIDPSDTVKGKPSNAGGTSQLFFGQHVEDPFDAFSTSSKDVQNGPSITDNGVGEEPLSNSDSHLPPTVQGDVSALAPKVPVLDMVQETDIHSTQPSAHVGSSEAFGCPDVKPSAFQSPMSDLYPPAMVNGMDQHVGLYPPGLISNQPVNHSASLYPPGMDLGNSNSVFTSRDRAGLYPESLPTAPSQMVHSDYHSATELLPPTDPGISLYSVLATAAENRELSAPCQVTSFQDSIPTSSVSTPADAEVSTSVLYQENWDANLSESQKTLAVALMGTTEPVCDIRESKPADAEIPTSVLYQDNWDGNLSKSQKTLAVALMGTTEPVCDIRESKSADAEIPTSVLYQDNWDGNLSKSQKTLAVALMGTTEPVCDIRESKPADAEIPTSVLYQENWDGNLSKSQKTLAVALMGTTEPVSDVRESKPADAEIPTSVLYQDNWDGNLSKSQKTLAVALMDTTEPVSDVRESKPADAEITKSVVYQENWDANLSESQKTVAKALLEETTEPVCSVQESKPANGILYQENWDAIMSEAQKTLAEASLDEKNNLSMNLQEPSELCDSGQSVEQNPVIRPALQPEGIGISDVADLPTAPPDPPLPDQVSSTVINSEASAFELMIVPDNKALDGSPGVLQPAGPEVRSNASNPHPSAFVPVKVSDSPLRSPVEREKKEALLQGATIQTSSLWDSEPQLPITGLIIPTKTPFMASKQNQSSLGGSSQYPSNTGRNLADVNRDTNQG